MLVNSFIAKPFANIVRNISMIEGCGVCGIGVKSINMCENLNVHSHELLARIVSVECTSVPKGICIHTVRLDKGMYTLDCIFNHLKGVVYERSEDTARSVFVATDVVTFFVITGSTSLEEPLVEDNVMLFAEQHLDKGYKLLTTPLPFLKSKGTIYKIKDNQDGTSEVTFDNLSENTVRHFISHLIL